MSPPLPDMRRVMTFEEMVGALDFCDQTVGCNNCGLAWWAENATEDPTLFHDKECPLYGRRDVAEHWFNVPLVERELGRRIGIEPKVEDEPGCEICKGPCQGH